MSFFPSTWPIKDTILPPTGSINTDSPSPGIFYWWRLPPSRDRSGKYWVAKTLGNQIWSWKLIYPMRLSKFLVTNKTRDLKFFLVHLESLVPFFLGTLEEGFQHTVVKQMIGLCYHAQQMFWMILSSVTKTFQNMSVLKIFKKKVLLWTSSQKAL